MKILLDPGHGYYKAAWGWAFQRGEENGVVEDLKTPYIAKAASEFLTDAGHEVFTTRPLPGELPGDMRGSSANARWKEAALYWLREMYGGQKGYVEVGKDDRAKDINIRAFISEFLKVDVSVSIHTNAAENNPEAHGIEVWHTHMSAKGKKLATEIHEALVATPEFDGKRGVLGDQPGYPSQRAQQLAFLRRTACPCALVECLFHTNEKDAEMLKSQDKVTALGEAIGQGIVYFLEGDLDA